MWFLSLVLNLNATSIGSLHHDTSTLQRISSLLGKKISKRNVFMHHPWVALVALPIFASQTLEATEPELIVVSQLSSMFSTALFDLCVTWTGQVYFFSPSPLSPPRSHSPHASTPYTASLRGGAWSFLSVCRTQPCHVHGYTDTRRSCMLCRGWVCFLARSASCTHNRLLEKIK